MLDNRATLSRLLDDNSIAMRQGATLSQSVPALPEDFDFDRVAGMLLGVAIGDALGRPSEGMIPSRRKRSHGEVRGYHRHRRGGGGPSEGHPSDDTQLTFWTLEQLLADGGLSPSNLSLIHI